MSEFIKAGRIVSTFGLKGQVKVELLTDFEERLEKGRRLRLKDDWVTVEACSWQKDRLLLKLSGVDDIDAAKALQWEYLLAPADEDIDLEEDEFLVSDLEGMKVVTVDGQEVGVVDEVAEYPAQDILVIGDIMIPLVKQFVKDIDLDAGVITIDPIEGLLDPVTSPDQA